MNERILPGLILGFLSALSFSLAAPFSRLAFNNGVVPVDAVATRAFVAFVFLSAFIWITRRKIPHIPRECRLPLVGLGLSTSLLSTTYLSSVAFIPVGVAAIIFFTFPLMILLLSPIVEKRPFGLGRFLIGLVALAGLYLAIGSGASLSSLDWRGVVLAGIGAVAGVGQFLFGRMVARSVEGPVIVWSAHFVIFPVTAIVAFFLGGDLFTQAGRVDVHPLGFLAVGIICVGYLSGFLCQVRALSFAPASMIAPVYNIEPVVSTTLAAYMFGERLAFSQYAGGALVLTALILSNVLSVKGK